MPHDSFRPGDGTNELLRKILNRLNVGLTFATTGELPIDVPIVGVANFPAVQPVSAAALPLPVGAATEATLQALFTEPEFTANYTGQLHGKPARAWSVLGRRAAFNSTSVLQDVAEFLTASNLLPEPTGAETWEIVSSDAADDGVLSGTGARQVRVIYVDAITGQISSKTAILRGTTPVPLIGGEMSASMILLMEVTVLGTSEVAVGNIDLRVQGTNVIHERITAGGNRSLTARFQIPTGYTGYVRHWDVSARGLNFTADARLRATRQTFTGATGLAYVFQDHLYCAGGGSASEELPWIKFLSGCRLKISLFASAAAAGNQVDTNFSVLLVQN